MSATTLSPYELLGAKPSPNEDGLPYRLAYRDRIQELKEGKISNDRFRLICRAYETLSVYNKRKNYDENKVWISDVPLAKYTLQQLAAEPVLASQLKSRLQNATLAEINQQDPNSGHTPLYCAARAGNLDAVIYLTEQGAEPDLLQKLGSSALHVSCFYGHPEIVRCLLECGANYQKQNSFGNLPERESMNGHVKNTLRSLKNDPFIQAGANQLDWFKENIHQIPNHIDEQYYRQRQTLLHCACKKGFLDLARWLIEECQASLDIVDINLNSALHLAAYGKHQSIVEYLLHQGANPLLINKWGMTAEQEGIRHGKIISNSFQTMRNQDMFQMAADGIHWWFAYYFDDTSLDMTNSDGTSLLYIACRCGQFLVAKWLLEHGANVNIQLVSNSKSTPLHGAAFNGHLEIVELLLNYGADVNIKNNFGETVFDNAQTDEIKQFLKQYHENLSENKILSVHLFGDGRTDGYEPVAKLQLPVDATRNDLRKAMPQLLRNKYNSFSIARRPLHFETEDMTVISAFCRARYGKTKFIEFPLCITVHESPRYIHSGHILSDEVLDYSSREFYGKFSSQCQTSTINVAGQLNEKQTFTCGNLLFTFPVNCTNNNISIEIEYINSPNFNTFKLPECVCLFRTKYQSKKGGQLNEMPNVQWKNGGNVRLYNWISSQPYWFTDKTKHTYLPYIDGIHAFICHIDVIPSQLSLPPDLFIQAAVAQPLHIRDDPVYCRCLKIREHNKNTFPHIAYHGTSIGVILSILMDGLVMPSTVVSSGVRVCPPKGHIARGLEAFGIKDFANGIFVSPSIHYCSDPVYAVTFSDDDQRLIAVLECSIKRNLFDKFSSTVKDYKPHPTDDPNGLEWRLTNPAAIEIISVLFIPQVKSRIAIAKLRANKLGVNPNDL
ncbi:hypothetical protein I4U23_016090 [Adineta vaga]|nr:hypothetical protein I4U23_016090 [Adineta vaga]